MSIAPGQRSVGTVQSAEGRRFVPAAPDLLQPAMSGHNIFEVLYMHDLRMPDAVAAVPVEQGVQAGLQVGRHPHAVIARVQAA